MKRGCDIKKLPNVRLQIPQLLNFLLLTFFQNPDNEQRQGSQQYGSEDKDPNVFTHCEVGIGRACLNEVAVENRLKAGLIK